MFFLVVAAAASGDDVSVTYPTRAIRLYLHPSVTRAIAATCEPELIETDRRAIVIAKDSHDEVFARPTTVHADVMTHMAGLRFVMLHSNHHYMTAWET